MKKVLSILLTIVMLVSTMTLTVFAASGSMSATDAEISVGSSKTITVSLTRNPGVMAFGVDADVPDGLSIDMDAVGMDGGSWYVGNSAVWDNSADSNYTGPLLKVTVTVDEDAEPGNYTIRFSASGANYNEEKVSFGSCSAKITVPVPECKEHTGGTATCTEKAVCEKCGESYGEALGHTGGVATCIAKAKCTRCGEEYGNLAAHTPENERRGVVEATETTAGYTGDLHCSVCGELLEKGREIPKKTVVDEDDNDYDDEEEAEYSISIGTFRGGKVICEDKYAAEGDTVRLQAIPNSGFELKELKVIDNNGKEIMLTDKGNGVYTFKMPDGKVTVKAIFAELEEENRNTGAI